VGNPNYGWLERGVCKRGATPLSITTPPLKHMKKRGLKDNLFERGLGGE